mmetsp:Transcript_15063/g.41895  ORF Transcript_15063/g.41895 Transcript_15063/m.41895 type:complete len:449 (-) Transcript_15063:219-1565(-)|eukprot:CAMPEP_0172373024 /NCGR_PEP_ID=MMETSP1060-20121228/50137_1 /TAXON_ID=37318 /ORGANISM="Pseudo-nitzschia pungens, Strain cf. cingulata" /LENGTH=448 /DNA_ID=CAMNT_0013099219 /DNA_START=76 /DNA_END=1422 /DNA_ORIENTATION=+
MCRLNIGHKGCNVHAACQDRNCSVKNIRQLVSDFGTDVLKERDVYGRVPLFYALRKRCPLPVIQTLFDFCPDAIVQPDFCGELPLYMLFHPKADYRILEYVLNRNPSLALYKEKSFSQAQSLFQRLCVQWENTIGALIKSRSPQLPSSSSDDTNRNFVRSVVLGRHQFRSDSTLCNQWAKLVLTIRAVHCMGSTHTTRQTESSVEKGSPSSRSLSNETPELHLALQLVGLPPTIICQFIELHPEQASVSITNAIAMAKAHPSENAIGLNAETKANHCSSMLPLHFYLSGYPPTTETAAGSAGPKGLRAQQEQEQHQHQHRRRAAVLRSLVRAFPEAAALRLHHRLPLHAAIAKDISWENGLEELVSANPSALSVEDDRETRLLPFLQRASNGAGSPSDDDENSNSNIDIDSNNSQCRMVSDEGETTVYCLLREDPSVLSRLVPSLLPP